MSRSSSRCCSGFRFCQERQRATSQLSNSNGEGQAPPLEMEVALLILENRMVLRPQWRRQTQRKCWVTDVTNLNRTALHANLNVDNFTCQHWCFVLVAWKVVAICWERSTKNRSRAPTRWHGRRQARAKFHCVLARRGCGRSCGDSSNER